MTDPIPPDVHARIRQAFLLGLSRQPLQTPPTLAPIVRAMPPDREPTLALLGLVGQRQRFVRPQPPAIDQLPEAARHLHGDPRPILPVNARRALMRLTGSVEKSNAQGVLSLAVKRVGDAGYRLHPFDLPELAKYIRTDVESLGLAERAYLALTGADQDDDGARNVFFERITLDNWTSFPRGHRRKFVADQRRTDPQAARALVESVWKAEPAPVRVALLEGLSTGLSAEDKPFLEKLATDRAPTVKQAATLMLARIPSAEGYAERIAAAASCFKRPSKTGLSSFMRSVGLSQGVDLTFAIPGPAAGQATNWAAMQAAREKLFAGITLPALAEVAAATPEEIIVALPQDEHQVLTLLLDTSIAEADVASIRRIVTARLASMRTFAPHLVGDVVAKARITLVPPDAARMVASPAWTDTVRSFRDATIPSAMKDDGRLIFIAALMPREVMPLYVESLASLTPTAARAARDYADLIMALPAPLSA